MGGAQDSRRGRVAGCLAKVGLAAQVAVGFDAGLEGGVLGLVEGGIPALPHREGHCHRPKPWWDPKHS